MKITIEISDGHVEEYKDVTDFALSMCQYQPGFHQSDGVVLQPMAHTRSIFGHYPRELVKEASFATEELRRQLGGNAWPSQPM